MSEAGKVAFLVLQTRFSNPKFWQAGLDLFLTLDGLAPNAAAWIEAAMQEVDEEARELARQQAQQRRLQEDKAHNKGRWSDRNQPATTEQLLAAAGMFVVDDDGRPGMSRDAQHELRLVTVLDEDLCVVCQEAMTVGSKAKAMPCGHKFHDECLISWVQKSNSCPTCRYDDMPSEKRHFDDIQRSVQQGGAGRSALYT
uniref:RING-type domain-containing protein n=1 Tax=Zooxanthella nutricula TaxID=1333877 RepID=A0A7S2N4W3_9DINO